MTLKLLHLTKKYGQQFALNDVSFTLKQGEIVGLLGPNGAGKSTLFKLITAYLPATSGEVLVNHLKASKQPLEVKKTIGYLPENNPLYPEMYVREYLGFIANLHKVSKTRIDKVIAQVGLEGEAPKKISQLSKGYKQRVGLASALIHNPSVLLLDEPTTGLDPNQIIEIRNLIKQIGQTKTVLFSSHILQEVEAICQRVLLINNGKLVADINLNDLKLASTALITLRFDKAVLAANLQSELQPKTIEKTGETSWLLSFENGVDSGAILFDFAKKHGLKIVEMTQKGADLESLFKQFTT